MQVAVFVGLAAVCAAYPLEYAGHGHGHAISTQNIVRHDGPSHVYPVSGHDEGYGHGQGHGYEHGHGHSYDEYVSRIF